MFSFLKNRKDENKGNDLSELLGHAIDDLKMKWIEFDKTIHLKPEFNLSHKIEMFAQPVQAFLQSKYPMLLQHKPGKVIWLAIFTAIAESKTHPQELVTAAVAELNGKYGIPQE